MIGADPRGFALGAMDENKVARGCISRVPFSLLDGQSQERVLAMVGLGDSPAPVGDAPTGMRAVPAVKSASGLALGALAVPSGGSPDGTGGSPVLPKKDLPNTL